MDWLLVSEQNYPSKCTIKRSLNSIFETLHLYKRQLNSIIIYGKINKLNPEKQQTCKNKLQKEKVKCEESLQKLNKLIDHFKGPFEKNKSSDYFYTPGSTTVMRKAWNSLFNLDPIEIHYNEGQLSNEERTVIFKKQQYLSLFNVNAKLMEIETMFENIFNNLEDEDLYEELVFSYLVLYDNLEFFEESYLWVNRLLNKYPEDQYLIIKKARLLSKMKNYAELGAHLEYARDFVVDEKLRLSLMVIKGEYFYGQKKYKKALEIWSVLVKNSYLEAPLFINLANHYLFKGNNFKEGKHFFSLVSKKIHTQNLRIKDAGYFYQYEECRQLLEEEEKDENVLEMTFSSSSIARKAPPNRCTLIYDSKRNEFSRYCNYEIAEKKVKLTENEKREKVNEMMQGNKAIKDFFIGFMSECSSTYQAGQLIARSDFDLKFKKNITITFLTFLLKRIPFVGVTLSGLLENFVQRRIMELMTSQAEQMIRFSPASGLFEKRFETIVYELILKPHFVNFLDESIQKVEFDYKNKMSLILNQMIKTGGRRTNAEILGKALAEQFFNNIVFKPKAESISNDNIISFLFNCLEFNNYCASLPPETVMQSGVYACFYSGFLSMMEIIYEVAESVLLSSNHCISRSFLLKKVSELEEKKIINFIERAMKIKSFFQGKESISDLVENTFKKCLEENEELGSKLHILIDGIKDYKFRTRKFVAKFEEVWAEEKMEGYKPFLELFEKDVQYEMKVGSVCAFHAFGKINLDDHVGSSRESLLVSGINHLSFEKKGFFNKLKDFCVTDRQSNINNFVKN